MARTARTDVATRRVGVAPDDRLLAPTRWTALAIIPVLVAGWTVLYLFPGSTQRLWAWTIAPDMTPLVMGGGYLSGAYFFSRVSAVGPWPRVGWHQVGWGFVATTAFTSLLLLATIVHWSRFNHDHAAFWAWLALYVATPLLLPWLWVRNQAHDPGPAGSDEPPMPAALRAVVAGVGAVLAVLVAVMVAAPETAADQWPWTLTPLTARTVAAFIAFPATLCLCFLLDRRWSSFEVPMRTVTIGLVLLALGAIRAREDFRGRPSVPVFVVALVGAIILLLVLQVRMGRRPTAPRPG